jgi:ADP-ribosylglycohydrolase/SAM-dependent methyltransferase
VTKPIDHDARMTRARVSLEGLATGDAFGECFFLHPDVVDSLIRGRAVPAGPWQYTDDTVMALAIVEVLEDFGSVEQDALAALFAEKYALDPGRGYGGMAHRILSDLGSGVPWPAAARKAFDGMGSMGNGGAMRSGPIGAYFADDLHAAAEHARRSAEITHAHPEGQAGAIAVALAAATAAGRRVPADRFLSAVLDYVPQGETRDGLARAATLPLDSDVQTAVAALGNGSRVLSQDTVPFALWCAARHPDSYEEALWATVAGLGDRDTTCAIVGSIVALSDGGTGIPTAWLRAREPLAVMARRRSFTPPPEVIAYYSGFPEESRLGIGSSRLEFERTKDLLTRFLPDPPARIVDVGGAAGAYSSWLAGRGYEVHLVDASARLVEEARARNASSAAPIASLSVADARRLPQADGSAAAVLVMGPLYHLTSESDRLASLREAFRVLAGGGTIVVTAISRCASALDGLARNLSPDPEFVKIRDRDLADGQHRNDTGNPDYFTTAYFHRPDDLRSELEAAGLRDIIVLGIEGPAWILQDFDARWENQAQRKDLLDLALALEAESSVLGVSAHLLGIGRKPR